MLSQDWEGGCIKRKATKIDMASLDDMFADDEEEAAK